MAGGSQQRGVWVTNLQPYCLTVRHKKRRTAAVIASTSSKYIHAATAAASARTAVS